MCLLNFFRLIQISENYRVKVVFTEQGCNECFFVHFWIGMYQPSPTYPYLLYLLFSFLMNFLWMKHEEPSHFCIGDKSKTGRNTIVEYFCVWETGSRTVGCCSHVMTVTRYLGYGLYNEIDIPIPSFEPGDFINLRTHISHYVPSFGFGLKNIQYMNQPNQYKKF